MVGNDLEVDPRRSGLKVFVFFSFFFAETEELEEHCYSHCSTLMHKCNHPKEELGRWRKRKARLTLLPPSIEKKEFTHHRGNTKEKLQKSTLRYKSVQN